MTFRDLLKSHFNQNDIEYIVFVFGKKLHKDKEIHSVDFSAVERIKNLFHELLGLEYKNSKYKIGMSRCIDDVEDKELQYIYDAYITEENNPVHYSLDFIDWKDIIDASIDETSVLKYGADRMLIEILWEITFDGYDYDTVSSNQKKILESISESLEIVSNGFFDDM